MAGAHTQTFMFGSNHPSLQTHHPMLGNNQRNVWNTPSLLFNLQIYIQSSKPAPSPPPPSPLKKEKHNGRVCVHFCLSQHWPKSWCLHRFRVCVHACCSEQIPTFSEFAPQSSCWCSEGNEGMTPISHRFWFPLRPKPGFIPFLISHRTSQFFGAPQVLRGGRLPALEGRLPGAERRGAADGALGPHARGPGDRRSQKDEKRLQQTSAHLSGSQICLEKGMSTRQDGRDQKSFVYATDSID